jgi:hypothetical protein
MSNADITVLGASKVTGGVASVQAVVPLTNDVDDVEPFGDVDLFQGLGITALPYPADASGNAEGVILRNCGGRDGVCIGGRDTRSAAIVGNMKPGDTVVHSTGPAQAAQLQLKEEKRQAVLTTKDSRGRTMATVLDGKNDTAQLVAMGAVIQIDNKGDISLTNASGAGIALVGNKLHVNAELALPGMTPGLCLMQGPPTGSSGGPTSAPMTPVLGVGK